MRQSGYLRTIWIQSWRNLLQLHLSQSGCGVLVGKHFSHSVTESQNNNFCGRNRQHPNHSASSTVHHPRIRSPLHMGFSPARITTSSGLVLWDNLVAQMFVFKICLHTFQLQFHYTWWYLSRIEVQILILQPKRSVNWNSVGTEIQVAKRCRPTKYLENALRTYSMICFVVGPYGVVRNQCRCWQWIPCSRKTTKMDPQHGQMSITEGKAIIVETSVSTMNWIFMKYTMVFTHHLTWKHIKCGLSSIHPLWSKLRLSPCNELTMMNTSRHTHNPSVKQKIIIQKWCSRWHPIVPP